MARLVTVAVATGVMLLAGAPPAVAHRDGCHRWHSCPSDSGSYVCGDLGYDTYCGGDTDTEPESEPYTAPVVVDYTPPAMPTVGRVTARAGVVAVPVIVERGSRIVVSIGSTVVGRFTGTGGRQILRFRGRDGSHEYEVVAEDGAGNESSAASFTADVDATAPTAPRIAATTPAANAAHTVVTVSGEPGARYSLRVLRRGSAVAGLGRDGTLDTSGAARHELLVANGTYTVTTRLRDEGGNRSRTTTRPLTVAIPKPSVSAAWTSARNAGTAVVTVTGPALGTGTVLLRGVTGSVRLPVTLDTSGTGTVREALADGTWSGTVSVLDFQRRRATSSLPPFAVDTVAPELTVTIDSAAAENRTIALVVSTTGDATTVTGLPGGPRHLADTGDHRIEVEAPDGDYDVHVEATDAAGNRVVRDLRVTVTHPLTLAEGLQALFGLALIALGGWYAWRRREPLARLWWRGKATAVRRRLDHEHRAREAAHAATVAGYRTAHAAYDDAHRRWAANGDALARTVTEAETFTGDADTAPASMSLRTGETCYAYVADAGLVEHRRPHGHDVLTVVDRGALVVTSERVVYLGRSRREWRFANLVETTHVGPDRSVMRVTNRQNPSGVAYGSDGLVRSRLELARATFAGERAAYVTALRARLDAHGRSEPAPPPPPPVPPERPVAPSATQLRDEARARREPNGVARAWPPAT